MAAKIVYFTLSLLVLGIALGSLQPNCINFVQMFVVLFLGMNFTASAFILSEKQEENK